MIVIVTGSSLVLATADFQNQRHAEQIETLEDMAYAKEALIAYAVQHNANYPGQGPGHLPCPDTDNDGAAEASCNNLSAQYLGRLPEFVTLPSGSRFPVSDTNAGIDQQFWYAVTPAFHMTGTGALNTASNSILTVDGDNDVVALIIAPGESVAGQSRVSNDVADYLEGGNQNAVNFVRSYATDPANFNDQIVKITRTEIITAMANKAAQEIKVVLDDYYLSTNQYYLYGIWGPWCSGPFNASGTYPQDNYLNTGCNTSWGIYESEQEAYDTVIPGDAVAWFANENWDAVDSYTFVSTTEARITFTGCNIVYTLNYNNDVSRDRRDCND